MKLRNLKLSDAELMLEWMQDLFIIENMQTDFASKTIDDCRNFIKNAVDNCNLNLAIVGDEDEYIGTVSLKHINNKNAEFAIVVRRKGLGKGYAIYGMRQIIKIAFEKYNLDYVYWCVNKHNKRAIKFYDKNGWNKSRPNDIEIGGDYSKEQIKKFVWYKVVKNCT